MKKINIAIDGPAGAGKSTIAKAVAKELGILYIDTGAMYRCVGLYGILHKIDVKNHKQVLISALNHIKIEMYHTQEGQQMILNGTDVSQRIRQEDVSMAASAVAVIPEVRRKLVEIQREIAAGQDVIMDGRDIGTYVLPEAELKIFLTASADARAQRRYLELTQKGAACDLEELRRDIVQRDAQDAGREFAPLRQAEDAVLLDTTDLTLEQAIAQVSDLARNIYKGE